MFAQHDRERARIDPNERRDALLGEPRTEIALHGVMRGMFAEALDHGARDARPAVLRGRS